MNTIKDIDFSLPYEGFLWMSNEQRPRLFRPETIIDSNLFDKHNPFIAEGYLYNKVSETSFSIKYVDGQYHIYRHEVKAEDFKSQDVDHITYLTIRMNDSHTLWAKFLRYWREVADPACLNMPVLELFKEVFVGFKEEEE